MNKSTSFADQTRETFKKLSLLKRIKSFLTHSLISEKRILITSGVRFSYTMSIAIGLMFIIIMRPGCSPHGTGSEYNYSAEAAAYHAKKLHRCIELSMSKELCYNDFVNNVDPSYDLPSRSKK